MKSLYVSDLDGTLLRSDETLSQFTTDSINDLVSKGMLFSYATARSLITAKKVTKGLNSHFPLIVYNGAFVIDNVTEEILIENYFEDDINEVLHELFENNIYPIVYAYIDGVEKFSFIQGKCTSGMKKFLDSRKGDKRTNVVSTIDELVEGNIFYITCIDSPEKLERFYKKYANKYHVVYQRDIYTDEQWLEIMPEKASKSYAIKELKEMLKADRLITFGDGKNDIDMFQISDESYAVENANIELIKVATGIIESNNNDGVAKWLNENFENNQTVVRFYDEVEDKLLKFAVIITRYKDKWVLCKHKERTTLEVPGGHREIGEAIDETAKRELYEETGAIKYEISPICIYSVTAPNNFDGKETFGKLYFAQVDEFEEEIHSEIEKIIFMEELPDNWTYPDIQPRLIEIAKTKGFGE